MVKRYKNSISNSYCNYWGRVYFAKTQINGLDLIKIGFYNGKYNILKALERRYKTVFTLILEIKADGDTEQLFHMAFSHQNKPVTYFKKNGNPVLCTEFFLTPEIELFVNSFKCFASNKASKFYLSFFANHDTL